MNFLQSRMGVSRAVLILALSGAMSVTLNFSGSFTALADPKGPPLETVKQVVGELKEKAVKVKQDLKKRAVEEKARRQAKREAKKEAKEAASESDEKGVRKVTLLYEKLKRGLSSKEVPCDVSEKSTQCEWEPFCGGLDKRKKEIEKLTGIVHGLLSNADCHPIRHMGLEILKYIERGGQINEAAIPNFLKTIMHYSALRKDKVEKNSEDLGPQERKNVLIEEIHRGNILGFEIQKGVPVFGFKSATPRDQFQELIQRNAKLDDSQVLIMQSDTKDKGEAIRSALNSYLDFISTEFSPGDPKKKILPGLYKSENSSHMGLGNLISAFGFLADLNGQVEKTSRYCLESKEMDARSFIGGFAKSQRSLFDKLGEFSKVFPSCEVLRESVFTEMRDRATLLDAACEAE